MFSHLVLVVQYTHDTAAGAASTLDRLQCTEYSWMPKIGKFVLLRAALCYKAVALGPTQSVVRSLYRQADVA